MRNHLLIPCIIVVDLLLGGCATSLSPKQCQHQDWQQQGLADGLTGKPRTHYAHYALECSKQGISIDGNTQYLQGWKMGNNNYCKPANGYTNGLNGHDYQGVCKGHNEAEFLQAYFQGLNLHTVTTRFETLEHKIRRNKTELTALLTAQDTRYRRLQRDMVKLRKEIEALKKHKPSEH
jgi:hypothetical protein